jgi:hypothetical protein
MAAMAVKCVSCGAEIPAGDVNLERALAKCVRCNAVFDIGAQIQRPARRPVVPMPKNIRILAPEGDTASSYETASAYRAAPPQARVILERRWFTPAHVFFAFFCVTWDGVLAVWYSAAIRSPSLASLVFPMFHVAVGVLVTYATLCGFFNRTRIVLGDGRFMIVHAPLPWPGNRSVDVAALDQLYCQEHIGSKGSRTYSLNMRSKDGQTTQLLKGLGDADQALFIEQTLEARLGIVDQPVPGELTRR